MNNKINECNVFIENFSERPENVQNKANGMLIEISVEYFDLSLKFMSLILKIGKSRKKWMKNHFRQIQLEHLP